MSVFDLEPVLGEDGVMDSLPDIVSLAVRVGLCVILVYGSVTVTAAFDGDWVGVGDTVLERRVVTDLVGVGVNEREAVSRAVTVAELVRNEVKVWVPVSVRLAVKETE